jgi:hypothetical protein
MKPELVTIKPCGAGVNKDLPAYELDPNMWSDSLNMRFANGIAERRYGIRSAWTTPLITPYAITTFVKTDGTRFVVYAGITKVYVDDGVTQTEITRYTDGAAISTITNVTTTATLTTATAHGRSTGNTVTVFGASPSAYNGTFVITVTGANTFTYTMLSDPGGAATTVGQYSYNVTSNFTGAIDDKLSLFVFNGILIVNNPVDGPYYWGGDTSTRLRRLPGWAAGDKCYHMGAFKNFLIALGPTLSSTYKPHFVMWSNSAEAGAVPTTWTSSNTNDAGDTPQSAEASGFLIEGRSLGDEYIVYKDDAIFALQYVGGNEVFSLRRMPGFYGLRARHCVVETPKGHVFLANGDVRIHAGGGSESIAEGVVRDWLIQSVDGTYSARTFLAVNPAFCEVWVVFPSYSATVPDSVAAWNWNDNTWGIFQIPSTTCGTTGLIAGGVDSEAWEDDDAPWYTDTTRWYEYEYSPNEQRLILGLSTPGLGLADTGVYDLGADVSWRLEKTGTSLGDNDSMKIISRVRPQFSASAGVQCSVTVGTTLEASDEPNYATAVTYTVGTSNWANVFSKAGRFQAFKFSGSDDGIVQLRSYDVEFARRGRF